MKTKQSPQLDDSHTATKNLENLGYRKSTSDSGQSNLQNESEKEVELAKKLLVYCTSESNGTLNFSLSVFPENQMSVCEQDKLSIQLHQNIKDHYERYTASSLDFSAEKMVSKESFVSDSLFNKLYDNFVSAHPTFTLSHMTYSKIIQNILFTGEKSSQMSLTSTENESLKIPTSEKCLHVNSYSTGLQTTSGHNSKSFSNTVDAFLGEKESEKEAVFFTGLNIYRKPNVCNNNSFNSEHSSVISHLSSVRSKSSHCQRKKKSKVHLHPLEPKCSCPEKRCLSVISNKERQLICKRFWMSFKKHRNLQWCGASIQGLSSLNSFFHVGPMKRRTVFIGKYFLHKLSVGRKCVCRHFFLTTLGLQYLFPLLDALWWRKGINQLSPKSRSPSRRKNRKKSVLKTKMKNHIHRHLKKLKLNGKIHQLSFTSIGRKYYKHFLNQFPHLTDRKSFEKYTSLMDKILKKKGFDRLFSSGYTDHIETNSNSYPVKSNKPAQSHYNTSNDQIMRIKPEDYDEVIADDLLEEKYKGSEQYTNPSGSFANISSKSKQHENGIILELSQHNPKKVSDKKCKTSKSYTKIKQITKPKKKYNKKSKNEKKEETFQPKKCYKISINEIEDDQEKHPILPPCNCAKNNCITRIPEEQRQVIHNTFWNLDNISRRGWLVTHVHILKPKSRSNVATARLHQMHRKFFLPNISGQLVDVCKKFFLSTLGFKGVSVLRPQIAPGGKSTIPPKKEISRKRHLAYQVCQQDVITVVQYCKSFSKEKNITFCGDEKFKRRPADVVTEQQEKINVPYGFTWKELYKDYCKKHSSVGFGYQTFRSLLCLVEQNNFSEEFLELFIADKYCQATLSDESTNDSAVSSFQTLYQLLQSFPKGEKFVKKKVIDKKPAKKEKVCVIKSTKEVCKSTVKVKHRKKRIMHKEPVKNKEERRHHRKKLKISKNFLKRDLFEAPPVMNMAPRTVKNSRYNFRAGVPQVNYSFNADSPDQNEDFSNMDWEDTDYDFIKEEHISDEEKEEIKNVVEDKPPKRSYKKRGRPPGKKKDGKKKEVYKLRENLKSEKKTNLKGRPKKSLKLKMDIKQQESTKRFKSRHPILPPCNCNYRKCQEKISEAQRVVIHDMYWSVNNKQDRCKWVLEHIKRCSPRTRSNTGLPSRKRETRRYYFPNDTNETIEVCRIFFLRTLGYHWDSVVDTVSRTLPRPDGQLATSLGFSGEQRPFEVITRIKSFLKHKKIKKSLIKSEDFPEDSQTHDGDQDEEDDVSLEGHSLKNLLDEFKELHTDNTLDYPGFKKIVRFILVPGSDAQAEWEFLREKLQHEFTDWVKAGPGATSSGENALEDEETDAQSSAKVDSINNNEFFTPEFEKLDLEKTLTRKAKRHRPVSSRNLKEQHPMREPCSCIRKCREKIEQGRRECIHEEYWDLITYNQRKQWILEHIKREVPKRRTNLKSPIKKMETRKFFLDDSSGKRVEICKSFFLATLGFKWDKMVDTICKTTPRDGQFVRPDQRGKKPPSHKLSDTLISSVTVYIESILETASSIYLKAPSKAGSVGGKQKKTTDRMPYGLTMKNLFEDYKIKHANHKVGYESFRKIYRSVIQSDKFTPAAKSSPPHLPDNDEDDNELLDNLSPPPQPGTSTGNLPMMTSSIESSSSVDRSNEQNVPATFQTAQSCMYRNQSGMHLHTPDQAHLPSYQRQCEASTSLIKQFPEAITSFPKTPHDLHQFYSPNLEQTEEMSMHMYKSICLPPSSNPNQPYPFYANSLPLETFPMGSSSQTLHGGLSYPDSFRHSDFMSHPYQPPHHPHHHHFGQGRFHGFVLPASSGNKESEPPHHIHHPGEINIGSNIRNEFDCHPYSGKHQLIYPTGYHGPDTNMSVHSNNQRPSLGSIPMQSHFQDMRTIHDSSSSNVNVSSVNHPGSNLLSSSTSSSNNVHQSQAVPTDHMSPGNQWSSQLSSPLNLNKSPSQPIQQSPEKKTAKRSKGRSKREPKEKPTRVKRERKVRPKSNRNSREFNPMLPPCKCNSKKCLEKIPEPRREMIYNMFWDLGCYNLRKQWIAKLIVREDPKRRTSLDNPLRRMETRRFFLPNDNEEKMEVCKGFFLRTLGFKWDKMVDTICKTTEKGQIDVKPDMRGKKGPAHKLKEEVTTSVENYVRSIVQAAKPTYDGVAEQIEQESVNKDKDQDIFVPYGLTMKNFHIDYKGKHSQHKIGYESFRKIFKRVSKDVLGKEADDDSEVMTMAGSSEKKQEEAVDPDAINPVTGLPQ